MMGTGTFAQPTFESLLARPGLVAALITQPDRATGAQRSSTRMAGPGMKELAIAAGIPVHQPESINHADGVALLRALSPDLLVVAAYGQILSREVLAVPRLGGINVHASLLPKYRGAAPVAWAIYHGETRTGVTIIRMSVGLDAGDILAQECLDILPDETAGELETRLAPLGARLAMDVADRLQLGPVIGSPQDKSLVTKAPKLKKEDGLLNWSNSAEQVCRQIRAMQPWPTAYSYLHHVGKPPIRIMVSRAAVVSDEHAGADHPLHGTVVVQSPSRLIVAAPRCEYVQIVELQPAGKRRMSAEEFIRGRGVVTGDRFGDEAV